MTEGAEKEQQTPEEELDRAGQRVNLRIADVTADPRRRFTCRPAG
jgi:hypothetical protein